MPTTTVPQEEPQQPQSLGDVAATSVLSPDYLTLPQANDDTSVTQTGRAGRRPPAKKAAAAPPPTSGPQV